MLDYNGSGNMSYVMPAVFSKVAMAAAAVAAKNCGDEAAQSGGGWTRLALGTGSASAPYVIAIRPLKDGRTQFACGCPHWKFRCQSSGLLCKHQQAVLCGGLLGADLPEIQWYAAGETFLTVLAHVTMQKKIAAHIKKKAA